MSMASGTIPTARFPRSGSVMTGLVEGRPLLPSGKSEVFFQILQVLQVLQMGGPFGRRWGDQADRDLYPLLDLGEDVGVLSQEGLGVLAALPDLIGFEQVPGAGLGNDPLLDRRVEQRALLRDPVPVLDAELGLAERCADLGLDDFDP